MAKTPISILQEYVVSKKDHLPDYFIEHCDNGIASFQCTVRVGSIKAVGYACTKKEAKQNSAKKALQILGASQNLSHQRSIAFIDDSMQPTDSVGYGTKKKDAKQDAAKNMLNKINSQDISLITIAVQNLDMEHEKEIQSLSEDVLKSYNNSTASVVDVTTLPASFPSFKNIKKTIFSLEDFGKELEKYGYKYSIETFQKEPYVLMMKINNTTITVMGAGKNKQLALNDLYENVVTMFDHGFTMTTTF